MNQKSILSYMFLALLLSFSTANGLERSTTIQDSAKIQQLADLCKLWGVVKYFHPEIAYGKIDWDKALVESIPKVEKAENKDEFEDAIQFMLSFLNDPETRVIKKSKGGTDDYKIDTTKEQPYYEWLEDSVAVIVATDVTQFENIGKSYQKFNEILSELSNAKGIIIDFRKMTNFDNEIKLADYFFNLASEIIYPSIITDTLSLPSYRWRYHYGFKDQLRQNVYYSSFQSKNFEILTPKLKLNSEIPTCFVVNEFSNPDWDKILALKHVGKAKILAESNANFPIIKGGLIKYKLSEDIEIDIRTSEMIFSDGTSNVQIDSIMPISSEINYSANPTIKAAVKLLNTNHIGKDNIQEKLPLVFKTLKENSYPEMIFPTLEYRLLALFRYWNAIEYFFPYKDLTDIEWEKALYDFIPKLSSVKDSLEYNLTLAELRTRINDSHGYIRSKILENYLGTHTPAIRTSYVEGKTIISKIWNDSLTNIHGLEVGDEILKIDNLSISKKREETSKFLAASNKPTLERNIDKVLLAGNNNSVVELLLQKGNKEKTIELNRNTNFRKSSSYKRDGNIWKLLNPQVGYIDLDRLQSSQIDSAFETMKETSTIIFDMRGYPNGTAWSIAPRLTTKKVKAAKFITPILAVSPDQPNYEYQFSEFKPDDKPKYKGKVIVLVNEQTISQAEYTCMILQACTKTKIIGSTTAGADGNVTNIILPGNITATFTGMGVEYPDGRQTQRVGIIPDIEVKPTIKGIREGRDEVLERAMEFIKNQK